MFRARRTSAGKAALGFGAAMLAVALPTGVLAFGSVDHGGPSLSMPDRIAFTPASADPGIAAMIARNSGSLARMMRFTPAGATAAPGERAVTVAVRIDRKTAKALTANAVIAAPTQAAETATGALSVTPTRYNLGIARGYGGFAAASSAAATVAAAPTRPATSLSRSLSEANIPDLSEFRPSAAARGEDSRFGARIALDEDRRADRASDSRDNIGDQLLDVGGSYRLTRNLDITAGVRYEQDRDLTPLPDVEQQDSQAVYVGTQFRF